VGGDRICMKILIPLYLVIFSTSIPSDSIKILPLSLVNSYQCFEGTCRLHLWEQNLNESTIIGVSVVIFYKYSVFFGRLRHV
jgi:hypothetical protein